jgi:hypothetical protein
MQRLTLSLLFMTVFFLAGWLSAPATPAQAMTGHPLPAADWYAWVYLDGNDLLYLVNPAGAQAIVKRPELPDEALPRNVQMAVSRDGSFLLQTVERSGGQRTLVVYDFMHGTFLTYDAGPDEDISLGVGSSFIFDADSAYAAVTFHRFHDTGTSMGSDWRIVVFDLTSGAVAWEIDRAEAAGLLDGGDDWLIDGINNINGAYFPRVAYVDNSGGIHTQLVLGFAGGASNYPAFVWYPDLGTISPSPYTNVDMDVRFTDGVLLFADVDPTVPIVPPDGPFESHNAIIQGTPAGGDVLSRVQLYATGDYILFAPRWSDNNSQVVLRTQDAASVQRRAMIDLATATMGLLPADTLDTAGAIGGALALSEVGAAGFDLRWHSTSDLFSVVWNGPPRVGEPRFLWAQPFGTIFGLEQIAITEWVNIPPDAALPMLPGRAESEDMEDEEAIPVPERPVGVAMCPGSPPSIVSVGMTGRVTIIDGRTLNARSGSSTADSIVRVLPEGERFQITGGPSCADGYTWWEIRLHDGVIAWVAEGQANRYFIEPASR